MGRSYRRVRSLALGITLLVRSDIAAAEEIHPVSEQIEAALSGKAEPILGMPLNLATTKRFYLARHYEPAWRNSEDAQVARAALADAASEGLEPSDYNLDRIADLSTRPDASATYDVLLTASLLQYEHDLRSGRLAPETTYRDASFPKEPFDPAAGTEAAFERHGLADYLLQIVPPQNEYRNLKLALAVYRAIERRGGWPRLAPMLQTNFPMPDERADQLRARLALEDTSIGASKSGADSASLIDALKRYQIRNGLQVDGRLSKATLDSLNVPVDQRISTIIANMERWRWVPRARPPAYVEVNTADASLKAVKGSNTSLFSRIVAGKPATPTPLFSAAISAITVNPYWIVPRPIARHEILPKLAKDASYLVSHHMFVNDNGFIEQAPGPDNPLGQIKLEMPNRFDAYLHGTPQPELFARARRYFSHGCMRVEKIGQLASFVLTGDVDSGAAQIGAEIASGRNTKIPLDRPLPVLVLYWTATADENGITGFRADIYGRDKTLLSALANRGGGEQAASNAYTDCGPLAG